MSSKVGDAQRIPRSLSAGSISSTLNSKIWLPNVAGHRRQSSYQTSIKPRPPGKPGMSLVPRLLASGALVGSLIFSLIPSFWIILF